MWCVVLSQVPNAVSTVHEVHGEITIVLELIQLLSSSVIHCSSSRHHEYP